MRRACLALGLLALAAAASASPASAAFGLSQFEVTYGDGEGGAVTQAGSHPFEMTTALRFLSEPTGEGGQRTEQAAKDILIDQAEGFVGNPGAAPRCSTADYLTGVFIDDGAGSTLEAPDCPDASAVGYASVTLSSTIEEAPPGYSAVYNLAPPPGVVAKLGFWAYGVPVAIEIGLEESPPYRVSGGPTNTSQVLEVIGATLTLWGTPGDEAHDPLRGHCLGFVTGESTDTDKCHADLDPIPFLTLPRSCGGPLRTDYRVSSWQNPGAFVEGFDETGAMSGCGRLSLEAEAEARPTSRAAASPSGLDFSLQVRNEGILNPEGNSNADIAKVVATLPLGMTANPSLAEGLETCGEAELGRETAFSAPGAGCPQASKIGTVEVETPLLEDELLKGSLYVAEPYENPFGTLLALYVVIKDRELGINVTQPLKVEPDPRTGQLVTTAEDMPQVPFSDFRLHFREGGRSPLITPPGCGAHTVETTLYPSSGGVPVESSSEFELIAGPGGGACPPATASFTPGFEAGTTSNAAATYSPFYMRLTRQDGEQDLSRFSAVLPSGVVGKIAGLDQCPEAGIAKAKARTGAHGAQEELDDPSCPAASAIGRTVAGAGVGSQLTYVGGALYLAGPYNGAPLSVVSITPARAGPFDAGTVVAREALTLNPVTARVEVDGAASDPIPHILKGIPLNVRDLRVYTDRPNFTLNPTSCAESQTLATLWGAGTALAPAAETPVGLGARFQAADCAALAFKPKIGIKLKGGVRRGTHPALKAVVTPRPGQANFQRAVVTLPRSAFLDQAHIRTICTRVQFNSPPGNGANCPKGAQYGYARAWSPLLDAPAVGPVYLRSSNNKLPDLVVALKGPASAPFDVELSSRIDSFKGGIRSTFKSIPDIPVSRFILNMQGGRKGLIVNSRHLCFKPKRNRARANLKGQNGRLSRTKPRVIATTCQKRRKAKRARAERSRGGASRASAVG